MADSKSVGVILDFLRRNHFTRAEAALRSELNNHHDLNGFLQELTLEEKALHPMSEKNKERPALDNHGLDFHGNFLVSEEPIVKEIECGTSRNVTESKCNCTPYIEEWKKPNEVIGASGKNFTIPKTYVDGELDLYSWKLNPCNSCLEPCQNDGCSSGSLKAPGLLQSQHQTSEALDMANRNTGSGEGNTVPAGNKSSWPGSSSRASTSMEQRYDGMQTKEPRELNCIHQSEDSSFKENVAGNPCTRTDENENPSSNLWRDCSVKTVLHFSKGYIPTSYDGATYSGKREEKRTEIIDIREAMKAEVDEVGRAIYAGKSLGSSEDKTIGSSNISIVPENQKEELPRLPPVKLKSEDNSLTIKWEEKFERHEPASKVAIADSNLLIGSYLDVPVGQEINLAGWLINKYYYWHQTNLVYNEESIIVILYYNV